MIAFMICITALDLFNYPDRHEAYNVCELVVVESERANVDPALAVALAHHESGLRRFVVSRVGALGPLQVIPKYYPKDMPRNTRGMVRAGLTILKFRLQTNTTELDAIAKYNGGNRPGKRSYRWAKSVIRLTRKLRGE